MLCSHTLGWSDLEQRIRKAVQRVLATHCTADISMPGRTQVGCAALVCLIVEALG